MSPPADLLPDPDALRQRIDQLQREATLLRRLLRLTLQAQQQTGPADRLRLCRGGAAHATPA